MKEAHEHAHPSFAGRTRMLRIWAAQIACEGPRTLRGGRPTVGNREETTTATPRSGPGPTPAIPADREFVAVDEYVVF
jgi:hypothetical protein